MMLLVLGLSFTAFTALSLAMEKHQQELHGKAAASPVRRTQWRVLGWVLLTVAFALCVVDHGWAMGPVLWLGALTLGGIVLAFAPANRTRPCCGVLLTRGNSPPRTT